MNFLHFLKISYQSEFHQNIFSAVETSSQMSLCLAIYIGYFYLKYLSYNQHIL